jgi:hypothetical protein
MFSDAADDCEDRTGDEVKILGELERNGDDEGSSTRSGSVFGWG